MLMTNVYTYHRRLLSEFRKNARNRGKRTHAQRALAGNWRVSRRQIPLEYQDDGSFTCVSVSLDQNITSFK